ncbi:MAG: ABC transporter permease subunit [Planctomycetaceae bacterium]
MLTFNPEPFEFLPALWLWVRVVASVLLFAVTSTSLISLIIGGPRGPLNMLKALASGIVDLVRISPGRTFAIAQLTFREAVRRKALLVFGVFAVLFMFAGWFLADADQRPDEQVKVLVSFVLTAITFLILPVALLLACWGIPEDIRRRSMHTIVTKPVRRSEIVLGRMLGYVGVNTLILLVMALVGVFWVHRQAPGSAESALVSRVPIFGTLSFLDKEGKPKDKGINVGDIWDHRSYIEGASPERAIYVFNGVTPDALTILRDPKTDETTEVLRLESTFEAFRTYKGDMDRGIYVQYAYANPDDPEKTRVVDQKAIFPIQEFDLNVYNIPRKIETYEDSGATRTVDLFDDVVSDDGRLQVEVSALDGNQYLGMAEADLFLRTPDRPFAVGFFKAVFGIWLMTVLVVVLGVTASTFLKGPVATLLTFVLFVIGSPFRGFMDDLSTKYQAAAAEGAVVEGGGPIESIIRIIGHMNPTAEMPDNALTMVVQSVDSVFLRGVWLVRYVIPDFGVYNLSEYVANGFDIGWSAGLFPAIAVTLAFLLPCVLLGYFSLRFRELETK